MEEIKSVANIVRAEYHSSRVYFKSIDLAEPVKSEFIPYLEAERLNQPLPAAPARRTNVIFLFG